MASKQSLAVLAIVAVALPFAMATDFIVGDEEGWKPNPKTNYTSWVEGKMFMVGDTLGDYTRAILLFSMPMIS